MNDFSNHQSAQSTSNKVELKKRNLRGLGISPAAFLCGSFFLPKKRKSQNGFKRCGAPFDLSLNLGERMISKMKSLVVFRQSEQRAWNAL